jgi:uncharacterized tellurite resistance protein B-like protein
MRTYPTDSPEAAARIVALTLVADGHVSDIELDTLERAGALSRLGIDRAQMLAVLRTFCEDLMQAPRAHWADACQIDPDTLNHLLAEVADPQLRKEVIALCVAVAEADDHVAEGESIVIVSAVEQWGLHYQMVAPPTAI